jgi:hypothetical protein
MQQAMGEAELDLKKSQAEKDRALAENALARTKGEMVKATKEAGTLDADIANKYADVHAKVAKVDQDDIKTRADAYNKIKTANQPKGGSTNK